MGNRAVITFSTTPSAPCVYLHWNGGRASVEAFLHVAQRLFPQYKRHALPDDLGVTWQYAYMRWFAEMLQVRFFRDPGMTVYLDRYDRAGTNNHDNGVYVIDGRWEIILRTNLPGRTYPDAPFFEERDTQKTAGIIEAMLAATPLDLNHLVQFGPLVVDEHLKVMKRRMETM